MYSEHGSGEGVADAVVVGVRVADGVGVLETLGDTVSVTSSSWVHTVCTLAPPKRGAPGYTHAAVPHCAKSAPNAEPRAHSPESAQ